MEHAYWNEWYFAWGWFLWIGVMFLLFSSAGNWGYTYRAHRKYAMQPKAMDILNERYARGELELAQYNAMKLQLAKT